MRSRRFFSDVSPPLSPAIIEEYQWCDAEGGQESDPEEAQHLAEEAQRLHKSLDVLHLGDKALRKLDSSVVSAEVDELKTRAEAAAEEFPTHDRLQNVLTVCLELHGAMAEFVLLEANRAKKREKERERRERLKAEGKLLSKTDRERLAKQEAMRAHGEAMRAQGEAMTRLVERCDRLLAVHAAATPDAAAARAPSDANAESVDEAASRCSFAVDEAASLSRESMGRLPAAAPEPRAAVGQLPPLTGPSKELPAFTGKVRVRSEQGKWSEL